MATLASNLQQLLAETDLTVSQLAREVGISQPVLFRLAKGTTDNPKVDTIRPVAQYFQVSIGQLLGDERLPALAVRRKMKMATLMTLPFLKLTQVPGWLKDKTSIHWDESLIVWGDAGESAFVYRVDDATMRGQFPEGAIISVDPDHPFKDHDYVIAETPEHDMPVFRQILFEGNQRYLKPLNSDFPVVKMRAENKVFGPMVELKMRYEDLLRN